VQVTPHPARAGWRERRPRATLSPRERAKTRFPAFSWVAQTLLFMSAPYTLGLDLGADIKANVGATRGWLSTPTRAVRLTS